MPKHVFKTLTLVGDARCLNLGFQAKWFDHTACSTALVPLLLPVLLSYYGTASSSAAWSRMDVDVSQGQEHGGYSPYY
jgi:hypothetical protein